VSKKNNFNNIPKILIGILTYCPEDAPKRLEIMKKALPTLKVLAGENVFFSLWDNNSCSDAKEFLENLDFIDFKYFSDKNHYDVAPIQFLSRAAELINADFVCHMEDDLQICSEGSKEKLDILMEWLMGLEDIGGSRILKWEIDNIEKYNKHNPDQSKVDRANMQSMYNVITGKRLTIEKNNLTLSTKEVFRVAKTNWHWYNFPIVCKTNIYKKVIPTDNIEPLQAQEGLMMKKYAGTGLYMGAMDLGLVTHLAPPTSTSGTSMRHHEMKKNRIAKIKHPNMGKDFPVIEMSTALEEVTLALKEMEKSLEKAQVI